MELNWILFRMSSNSAADTENSWTGKIIFTHNGNTNALDADDLSQIMKQIGPEEKIKSFEKWSNKLDERQVTDMLLHHAILVIETNQGFWSFEKNDTYIEIQKNANKSEVSKKLAGTTREKDVKQRRRPKQLLLQMSMLNKEIWDFLRLELDIKYNSQLSSFC